MSVFGEGILSPHCYEAPSVICMTVIFLVPRPLDVVMDETDSAVVPHILSEQAIKIIIILMIMMIIIQSYHFPRAGDHAQLLEDQHECPAGQCRAPEVRDVMSESFRVSTIKN